MTFYCYSTAHLIVFTIFFFGDKDRIKQTRVLNPAVMTEHRLNGPDQISRPFALKYHIKYCREYYLCTFCIEISCLVFFFLFVLFFQCHDSLLDIVN
jgi:hypothetical protein